MANKDIINTEVKWKRFEDTLKVAIPDLAMRNKVAVFLLDWAEDFKVELREKARIELLMEVVDGDHEITLLGLAIAKEKDPEEWEKLKEGKKE